MWKRLVAASIAAFLGAGALAALAGNVPLLTGPVDPGNLRGTLNTLIQSINTNTAGLLNANIASTATGTGTAEQTLQTYTMPASTLASDGQGLRITCFGTTAANGNNKTMKLYFGTTSLSTGVLTLNNKAWVLRLEVTRTGAATQTVLGTGVGDSTNVATAMTAGTDALTSSVIIKCTGTDGTSSAGDIVATGMRVETIK